VQSNRITALVSLTVLTAAAGLAAGCGGDGGNGTEGSGKTVTMWTRAATQTQSQRLVKAYFEAVPRELEEAALVDGCTTFSAWWRILLRAVRPGLITVGLFAFLASWNDFFAPLILLNDGSNFTLPVALVSMRERTFGAIDYGALEAGVMVTALPCLVLFLVLQRHYVRGFLSGALCG
jgi:ABC-type glycerol-3-phosphate transport system permease component